METWLDIPGFEGAYQVSDHGRVRSLDRLVAHKDGRLCKAKGKILTLKPNVGGYPSLRLGRGHPAMVHQLVALAFLGPAYGRFVCHNDNDKSNNHLPNLRYDTPQGNMDDRIRHGTTMKGSQMPFAILDENKVAEIKKLLPSHTHEALAARYGVCGGTISAISSGKNWKHV